MISSQDPLCLTRQDLNCISEQSLLEVMCAVQGCFEVIRCDDRWGLRQGNGSEGIAEPAMGLYV